jgi:hypothetical protein
MISLISLYELYTIEDTVDIVDIGDTDDTVADADVDADVDTGVVFFSIDFVSPFEYFSSFSSDKNILPSVKIIISRINAIIDRRSNNPIVKSHCIT